METIEKLSEISIKLQGMLKAGKTLQEITKLTYEARENGENMMYFSWLNKNQGSDSCLIANPTSKQKEFKNFLKEKMDGSAILTKYVFYVFQDRVEFENRMKVNGEILKFDATRY